jgi:hypothetical protein
MIRAARLPTMTTAARAHGGHGLRPGRRIYAARSTKYAVVDPQGPR